MTASGCGPEIVLNRRRLFCNEPRPALEIPEDHELRQDCSTFAATGRLS